MKCKNLITLILLHISQLYPVPLHPVSENNPRLFARFSDFKLMLRLAIQKSLSGQTITSSSYRLFGYNCFRVYIKITSIVVAK